MPPVHNHHYNHSSIKLSSTRGCIVVGAGSCVGATGKLLPRLTVNQARAAPTAAAAAARPETVIAAAAVAPGG